MARSSLRYQPEKGRCETLLQPCPSSEHPPRIASQEPSREAFTKPITPFPTERPLIATFSQAPRWSMEGRWSARSGLSEIDHMTIPGRPPRLLFIDSGLGGLTALG